MEKASENEGRALKRGCERVDGVEVRRKLASRDEFEQKLITLLGTAVKKSNSKSDTSKNLSKRHRRRQRSRAMRLESLENREMLAADFGLGVPAVDLSVPAVPNELVIQFEPGITRTLMDLIARENGAEIVQAFPHLDSAHIRLLPPGETPGTAAGSGQSLGDENLAPVVTIDIINQWTSTERVLLAEPNYIEEALAIPNDEFHPLQWGNHNDGSFLRTVVGIADADIDGHEAWEITTGQTVTPAGSNEVVIAIIDTGTSLNPSNDRDDLRENFWINSGEIPNNGIDDDGNGLIDDYHGYDFADLDPDPSDADGHGTHVAGTVGAVGNNDRLVSGVAWNTKLMILRAGNPGFATAAQLGSYNYMIDQKLRGVNLVASNNSYGGTTFSGISEFAIGETIDAGILFVAASGNDGVNNDFISHYPSGYALEGIISVGASDAADELAVFSNNGVVTVDLHAPGVDILSTQPDPVVIDFLDGTSMASPHVAGVAALLGDLAPGATPAEIKSWILQGVDVKPVFASQSVTGGRLNAMGAIDAMPRGTVSGVVFDDLNENGSQDAGELGIGGVTILLDRNFDGLEQETGEWSVVSANDGSYSIPNYWHTDFQLVVTIPAPPVPPGPNPVPPPPSPFTPPPPILVPDPGRGNDALVPIPFIRDQPGGISGVVYNDQNADGRQDLNTLTAKAEPGLGGVYVFLDLNGDDRMQLNEPTVITSDDGRFDFAKEHSLGTGNFTARIIVPPGWSMTTPGNAEHGFMTGLNTAPITNLDYGLTGGDAYDFGDLGTDNSLVGGGARHGVLTGFHLGADIDREVDAVATDGFDDGVTITSSVFAGGTVTADVEVSLGGFRPGFLQVWVDLNGDGTFGADEQVIANERLMEGMHEVSFVIPESATTGAVAARFRYGWEFGIGPTGPALAGEVEDYMINVAGDTPVANPDFFSVSENSSGNSLAVLTNDFPSSSGGLFVQSVDTAATSGTVAISTDQQTLIFTPRASFTGTDTLTYTVSDGSGLTSTASVSIIVIPTFSDPVAVDDQEVVALNSPGTVINVLLNDLPGNSGPLRIISTGLPSNGSVSFSTSSLTYTPNLTYQGIDQFTYTVADGIGVTSTAVVTTFVGDATSDDSVAYFVEFTTLDGVTPLPSNQISLGGDFLVNIYVQDIRPTTTQLPEADHGVFAGFLDVLYPAGAVSLEGALAFNGDYTVVLDQPGTLTPGIIDEAGAIRDIDEIEPGSAKKLLFRAPFKANALGVVTFVPNPADLVGTATPQTFGDHDTLVYNPTTHVLPNDVSYLPNTLTVVANSEGPQHNPVVATDINGDGQTNTLDVAAAAMGLLAAKRPDGESIVLHRTTGGDIRYFDVTDDQNFSTHDLLAVILKVNDRYAGLGEPGDILSVRPASGEPVDFSSLQTSSTSDSNLPVDQSVSRNDESSTLVVGSVENDDDRALLEHLDNSSDVEGDDDFFSDILAAWE